MPVQLKIGHGGTLDPLATGVLIAGIGKGTKRMPEFLDCMKAYEAVVLFGVATDSYDRLGKIVGRAPYEHVTREKFEEALKGFRGKIMQRPPIFSALRVQGKRLYQYAREGIELPVEIKERPVGVQELEIVEWIEGGQHEHKGPTEEADKPEKSLAQTILHVPAEPTSTRSDQRIPRHAKTPNTDLKRKRQDNDSDEELIFDASYRSQRSRDSTEPLMSGGLSSPTVAAGEEKGEEEEEEQTPLTLSTTPKNASSTDQQPSHTPLSTNPTSEPKPSRRPGPPAVRIRMTVSSGFYVRSLCHDLGAAVGSLAIMSELVRTRQADFELGKNVLEYTDLKRGEDVWGPKVEAMLDDWNRRSEPGNDFGLVGA